MPPPCQQVRNVTYLQHYRLVHALFREIIFIKMQHLSHFFLIKKIKCSLLNHIDDEKKQDFYVVSKKRKEHENVITILKE